MVQGALAGLAIGGVYAIVAVCLALMFTLGRVINFAQSAVGMFGAFLAAALTQQGLPVAVSAVLGILSGALVSAAIGATIAIWMPEAGTGQRSAVTVGALLLLLSLSYILFGTEPMSFVPLVSGRAFEVDGVVIGQTTVVVVALAVLLVVVSKVVLGRTSLGTRLRAVADRPVAAELVGIRVTALALAVWLGSGLAVTLAVLVVAPTQTSDAPSLALLVVPAAAAALLGGFTSLYVALAGGLVLGMVQGVIAEAGGWSPLREWIPLTVIVALLLWNQRQEVWDAAR
jgi:branched-chain amino acid transport system permease protein